MDWRRIILFAVVLVTSLSSLSWAAEEFTPLFDGKSLTGWNALPGGNWQVVDGAIEGTQEKSEQLHGILLTEKMYDDFVVRLKYKALDGNSGLYFRAEKVDHPVAVKGIQAEIDSDGNDVGGLYETLGRAWIVKPSSQQIESFYNSKGWNELAVTAIGGNVTVAVNGVTTARLKNDSGARKGYVGLQLHGGHKMHVLFKDIEIRELADSVQPVIVETIHDISRPLPRIVEPQSLDSLRASGEAPNGAIVLFDGSSLVQWTGAQWEITDGVLETTKGDLKSKQGFADCRLHVEWRIVDPKSHGNSGVYLMEQYEVQIFNSYHNQAGIYADGQAAAIYGQYPPLVNACRPPGEWEVFDITFYAPRFNEAGKLTKPARVSLLHNGILVQDGVPLTGPTDHGARPPYKKQADRMPVVLQFHHDRLQFRNIWIQEL